MLQSKTKKRLRKLTVFLGTLILLFAALWAVWKVAFDPYRGSLKSFALSESLDSELSSSQALDDMNYIVTRLKQRHPACMDGLPDSVQSAYDREIRFLSAKSKISVLELWQSAARVLTALSDGHTSVRAYSDAVRYMPLTFEYKGDKLYCTNGVYAGSAVIEIGGISAEQLYERYRSQFSYELEQYARYTFAKRISASDYLAFVGVNTASDVKIELEKTDGTFVSESFEFQADAPSDAAGDLPFVFYSVDKEHDAGILTLRECEYNDTYKNELKEFFTQVSQNNIGNVILDLRGNPGGNSMVGNEFMHYLPVSSYQRGSADIRMGPLLIKNKPQTAENHPEEGFTFDGDVYVLTDTASFSSAVDFAVLLSDNGLCTLIGETPGNMPSSYGDILRFQTPNAKLAFTVSYKYFTRPDQTKNDLPLIPDVEISAEKAMDEALRLIGSTN